MDIPQTPEDLRQHLSPHRAMQNSPSPAIRIVHWAALGFAVGAVIGVLWWIPKEPLSSSAVELVYTVAMIVASASTWSGGLLGAFAAAIAGIVLSHFRPDSPRIGLGATAIFAAGVVAFVQFGPFSFRLKEVTSRAEPAVYYGPCPATVRVIGRITVAGAAGEVNYQFGGPTMTPDTKLVFDAPGTREVSATWTVGKAGNFYDRLEPVRLFVWEPKRPRQLYSDSSIRIHCTTQAGR